MTEKILTISTNNQEDAQQIESLGKLYALKAIEHSAQNTEDGILKNVDFPFGTFKIHANCIVNFETDGTNFTIKYVEI